jgi:hypothetical protein
MKRDVKRLVLSKETLLSLDGRALQGVAGALVPQNPEPSSDIYRSICSYCAPKTWTC